MILLPQSGISAETVGSEIGTTPDTKPEPRLDAIGVWWITFGAVWTVLLLGGMTFLYTKRNTPTLRLRGLSLTFASIILLHLYWITVQIGYSVGPLAPEVAEFWIMSIWYPFGIALFQAGNSQFLHVARAQSRFARPLSQMETQYDEKQLLQKAIWLPRLLLKDYTKRMFVFVTLGMAVQLFVVVIIYMISRKFHPDFGIPGTEVAGSLPMEIAMKQGRGWEWWPSIVWQFVWAWIIAPIILWRCRGIHDTHGWQHQTIACCVAGLPAAPMWLIALYVPGMAPVNRYFLPPQWTALPIFVIEIYTVFVPCWQVRKHQNLRQKTLESIANCQSKTLIGSKTETSNDQSSAPPLSPTSTKVGEYTRFDSWKKLPSLEANNSQPNLSGIPDESVLTMAALEHVLDKNPEPLRQFSARRDFSGENIGFLTAVAEWKATFPPDLLRSRDMTAVPDTVLRMQFTHALRIYTEFISPRDAEFPINIAGTDLRKLQGIFERAARASVTPAASMLAPIDAVTSFVDISPLPQAATATSGTLTSAKRSSRDSASELAILQPQARTKPAALSPGSRYYYPLYQAGIPPAFDSSVFDAAQASIKYLVLTNTWPKYVRERRSLESSSSSSNGGGNSSSSSFGGSTTNMKGGGSTTLRRSGGPGGEVAEGTAVGRRSVRSKIILRRVLGFAY
ncbi:hypothetical protein N657DRAFT_610514 [Parathielavia appendiculata]|uniref:RGS domain-containing protein n=1 Tax=Parathielavia appendiculata TaxID=2587402 RepID=A0AAN6UBB1_9PEZI|nr:hypothetical protein N657DRAFT_610514 [Parathielavia appendiculata]